MIKRLFQQKLARLRTGFWFLLVGASAAAVHLIIYGLTLDFLKVQNEWANALGFIIAFLVSFFGHRNLSFKDTSTQALQSFMRFGITACAGFCTNEIVFMILYRGARVDDWLSLIAGIIAAAVQTFLLSRFWAFKK
jgi:putative flippase GtrA